MNQAPRLPFGTKKHPRDDAEFRLQAALIQHLRLRCLPGTYYCAIPNGEYRSKRTAGRLKAAGVRAGSPDLLIIRDGHAYGLELKALRIGAKGKPLAGAGQSEAQILAQKDWEAAGGDYAVATGIAEALAKLEEWKIIRPDRGTIPVYATRSYWEHAA